MTNKEAAIVLKQYVSNNFKISGLYAFLHPTINPDNRKTHIESILTDAFQCAYKTLARQDYDDVYGPGFLIRHNFRMTYGQILEQHVSDNFNISKLSCIVQPEIAEDHREEQAKVLLTIAIENACAVLSNSDD